jgi:ATP-dependent DNA helicase 2 subunit 1
MAPPHAAADEPPLGEVHVNDALLSFGALLSEVRIRTYPQRSVGSLTMQVGVDAHAPGVKVSLFMPVSKCGKPKTRWLQTATNAVVTTETSYLDKDTGAVVATADLAHRAAIGAADAVQFAPDEVATMKGQFGSPAIRVLGFKPSAAYRGKWCVGRALFLHPTHGECGHAGVKFFAALHRTLAAAAQVAIAEVIVRAGTAPRLAVLQPATAGNTFDEAVTGCGFHLMYLPYADDYRALAFRPVPAPDDALVTKAKKVIRALSVAFDAPLPNPALQRQYHVLQQMALSEDGAAAAPIDATLPDREGMAKYAHLYDDFVKAAYPPGYAPESMIAAAKPAKPPPTTEELAAVDVAGLEAGGKLATLTVPYLRQYLKENHEATDGLKKDLVDRVAAVVQRKRPRD